jgi:hypothetical protein
MTFAAWSASRFTAAELADVAKSGFTADFEGDGIPNGLEYALGGEPKTPSASALPKAGMIVAGGKHYMTFTFTQLRTVGDIVYTIETSTDLATWHSGAGYAVRTDDGSTDFAVYKNLTAIEDAPRAFMRLKVTQQ